MRRLVMVCILAASLLTAARAAGETGGRGMTAGEVSRLQAEALDAGKLENALPDEAGDMLGGIGVSDSLDLSRGLGRLVDGLKSGLKGAVSASAKSAGAILVVAVICSIVAAAFEGGARYATVAGVLAVSAISLESVNSFIGLGGKTLDDMYTFSKLLLPTLTAAAAGCGAVTSAAAKYSAAVLFMDILITVSKNVIVPLIYAYTAVSVAEAALGGEALSGVSGLLKWLAKTIMTVIMLSFVAYLSLTGVVSGTTDAVAAKAVKTTISTVLPVVGGIISDAADTVLAGASILRNAIGIFGLLAVAAMCLAPFLRLGASYLMFKASAGLAGAVSDSRLSKLVSAFATAFGMMLGLVGACALMLFVSIVSVIRVASGIA